MVLYYLGSSITIGFVILFSCFQNFAIAILLVIVVFCNFVSMFLDFHHCCFACGYYFILLSFAIIEFWIKLCHYFSCCHHCIHSSHNHHAKVVMPSYSLLLWPRLALNFAILLMHNLWPKHCHNIDLLSVNHHLVMPLLLGSLLSLCSLTFFAIVRIDEHCCCLALASIAPSLPTPLMPSLLLLWCSYQWNLDTWILVKFYLLHLYWDLLLHYQQLALTKLCLTPCHCCDVNLWCFATPTLLPHFTPILWHPFTFFHPLCLCHVSHQCCNVLSRFYHILH